MEAYGSKCEHRRKIVRPNSREWAFGRHEESWCSGKVRLPVECFTQKQERVKKGTKNTVSLGRPSSTSIRVTSRHPPHDPKVNAFLRLVRPSEKRSSRPSSHRVYCTRTRPGLLRSMGISFEVREIGHLTASNRNHAHPQNRKGPGVPTFHKDRDQIYPLLSETIFRVFRRTPSKLRAPAPVTCSKQPFTACTTSSACCALVHGQYKYRRASG